MVEPTDRGQPQGRELGGIIVKSFKFKKSAAATGNTSTIDEGVHRAAIIQVANVGLQRPFEKDVEPEPTLAVVFELENGEQVAKRMKLSNHPSSGCYALFTAAFPRSRRSR